MSTEKKAEIRGAKAAVLAGAQTLLTSPVPTFGLPRGVRVETNAAAVARFPLPLTIGAAIILAIGAVAAMKGHKIIGVGLLGVGVLGIGAAAAAPELSGAIKKTVGAS